MRAFTARLCLVVAPLLGGSLRAEPPPVILSAADCGFINAAGRTAKNDGVILGVGPATFNYSAGAIDEAFPLSGTDVPRRNFFTFDLTGITSGSITVAKLELFLPMGGFGSPDGFETYILGGTVATGAADMASFAAGLKSVKSILVPPELASAMALYVRVADSLAVPVPPFASVSLTAVDAGTMVSLTLNSFGLTYLNAYAGGKVVLGGELATLNGVPGPDEFVFGFSAPLLPGVVSPDPIIPAPTPAPTLTLTVIPEPTTLLAAAALAVSAARMKRRHTRRNLLQG